MLKFKKIELLTKTCYPFLGSQKKMKMKKYKKIYIKKYSEKIQKIIEARNRCWNAEKMTKLVEEVQKYKMLKFDSIFLTDESPVDKENSS
jgi:RecB family exonuclease